MPIQIGVVTSLLATITFICQSHYIFNIVVEMADACHISVFTVKSKDQQLQMQLDH